MAKVKYISSTNEIPAGQKYVLVMYGEEYAQTTHTLGLTITVARTVSQLSFLTAVHTAKGIAKSAGIPEVFVCTAAKLGPHPQWLVAVVRFELVRQLQLLQREGDLFSKTNADEAPGCDSVAIAN
jgi:hypothetical protein